ncbi:MAG: hypothetical protein ACP5N9_03480 [Candidatus Bilamarchaeum sp.]|jgi:hypothetical protein
MVEVFREQKPVENNRAELNLVPQRVPQNLPRVEIILHGPEQSLSRVAALINTRSEGSFNSSRDADFALRVASAIDNLHLEAGSNMSTRFGRMVSGTSSQI